HHDRVAGPLAEAVELVAQAGGDAGVELVRRIDHVADQRRQADRRRRGRGQPERQRGEDRRAGHQRSTFGTVVVASVDAVKNTRGLNGWPVTSLMTWPPTLRSSAL